MYDEDKHGDAAADILCLCEAHWERTVCIKLGLGFYGSWCLSPTTCLATF